MVERGGALESRSQSTKMKKHFVIDQLRTPAIDQLTSLRACSLVRVLSTRDEFPMMKTLSLAALCAAWSLFPGHANAGQHGMASIYSYKGGKTASGDRSRPGALTAAHRSLPMGSKVRVTNRRNGRSVIVRINDRGPFIRGRIIDVTPAAAHQLNFSGLTLVSVERLGR